MCIKRELVLCVFATLLHAPRAAHAQAGPPFLTNDPGTPGNGNWEINLAAMPFIARGESSYQLPQIDVNFGMGARIQFTYEVPYVVATRVDEPTHSGWSNGNPGIKWRFLDQGEGGWQASVFPQVQTGASRRAQVAGIGAAGPRLLLPVEVSRKIGPLDFDVEAGYYLPEHGPREHILGFATGRSLTEHLELDAELYEDRADHSQPDSLALDLGGRYILGRGLIALFMIGRSVNGFANGQPQFQGYFGIQILLSNYGRTLTSVP